MRRLLAISLTGLVLTAGLFGTPAEADVKGPGCVDINGNSDQSSYVTDFDGSHQAVLSIQITTVDPRCKAATYTLYLSTDGSSFTAYAYPGDAHFTSCGPGCLTFTNGYGSTATQASAAPAVVYIYLESALGAHVFDRAPNNLAPPFALCDYNPSTHDYDGTGTQIPPCNPPGGNYFE